MTEPNRQSGENEERIIEIEIERLRPFKEHENLYGYAHGVVKTKKQKKEADNNRRYAAYYNQICMI